MYRSFCRTDYRMSHQKKSRILAHLRFPSFAKPTRPAHLWAATGMGILTLSAVFSAFGTAPSTLTTNLVRHDVVENLAADLTANNGVDAAEMHFTAEERIRPGDSAQSLLRRLGVDDIAVVEALRGTTGTAPIFSQISPGKTVTAILDKSRALVQLTFPLNGQTDKAIVVDRQGDHFKASERNLAVENQTTLKSATIRYSLFGATDAAGIPDAVATQLADIFGGDIDFHRDLRKGDHFSVLYETVLSQGRLVRTGKVLAAEFVNDGQSYRALWFADNNGRGGYYSPDGKSLRKAFLRSPLEFSRVTSGFSSARFHPVLQTWRAHKGVDYGAPVGTHVRATADGTVEFAGVQGGYGKVVILKHQGRYSTLYGHLSSFAKGLHTGSRVNQGDIIANTGMSGLASGPHLHYEFRIDGVHQNPLTVALPGAPMLTPQQLPSFKALVARQLEPIEMLNRSNLSALD